MTRPSPEFEVWFAVHGPRRYRKSRKEVLWAGWQAGVSFAVAFSEPEARGGRAVAEALEWADSHARSKPYTSPNIHSLKVLAAEVRRLQALTERTRRAGITSYYGCSVYADGMHVDDCPQCAAMGLSAPQAREGTPQGNATKGHREKV